MKKLRFLFICLFLLGVGFAAVSTTLYLTGNVKVASNNADFDVIFTKAVLDGEDISSSAISNNGKTITFTTKDLVNVNDISKLDFDVTNNSEMYNAEVSIVTTINNENKDYYEITKEVASSISAKTTGKGKVEIKLLKASTDNIKGTFKCTLTAKAKERTKRAESTPTSVDGVDVRFTRAIIQGCMDVTSTVISEDGKTITYDTGISQYGNLSPVGDSTYLIIDVTNNSETYDADINVQCRFISPISDSFSLTTEIDSPVLAKSTNTGDLTLELVKETTEDTQGIVSCTLTGTKREG